MYVACRHAPDDDESMGRNAECGLEDNPLLQPPRPFNPQAPWQLAGDQQLVSAQSVDQCEHRYNKSV